MEEADEPSHLFFGTHSTNHKIRWNQGFPILRGLFVMPSSLSYEVFWQYTTQDNAFGPAALSPDERTVYVVDGKGGISGP